ncbi:MAG: TIGR01620 family protein [Proteobacteria bacterium]|nr:TIGR01620 family protein [Pseudomonadota bacterium]
MTGVPPRPQEADPATVRPIVDATPPGGSPVEMTPGETRPAPAPARIKVAAPRRKGLGRFFFASLGLFVVAALSLDLWRTLAAAFTVHAAAGWTLAALAAAAVASGLALIIREINNFWRELNKLHEVELLARDAGALIAADGHGAGLALAARILEPVRERPELESAVEAFRARAGTGHSDRQVLALLTETVVRPLDRRAYAIVGRAARDAGMGVALSPFGLLDAGLVIWRGLRMIRDVAAVYGFRPGFLARMRLLRRILGGAAVAGGGDFVTDAMLAHAGGRLGGLLSVRAGEWVLTAVRTARLGLLTMEACRPVPFTAEDRTTIARLLRELSESRDQPLTP